MPRLGALAAIFENPSPYVKTAIKPHGGPIFRLPGHFTGAYPQYEIIALARIIAANSHSEYLLLKRE